MKVQVRALRKSTALVVAILTGGLITIAPVLAGNGAAVAATKIVARPASDTDHPARGCQSCRA